MDLCSAHWRDLVMGPVLASCLLPGLHDHEGGLHAATGLGIARVTEAAAVTGTAGENEASLTGETTTEGEIATVSEASVGEVATVPHSRVIWEDELPPLLQAVTLRSSDGTDFIVGVDSGLAQMSVTISNLMKCTKVVPIATL